MFQPAIQSLQYSSLLFEGKLDYEFQYYMLKAFVQDQLKRYKELELYPALADVITRHQVASQFIEKLREQEAVLPKTIEKIDLSTKSIKYKALENNELIEVLKRIATESVAEYATLLKEGKQLYDIIESELILEEVGIIPEHKTHGFFLFSAEDDYLDAFYWQMKQVRQGLQQARGLATRKLGRFKLSLLNTVYSIKKQLIDTLVLKQTPYTLYISSPYPAPVQATLLPILKRHIYHLA